MRQDPRTTKGFVALALAEGPHGLHAILKNHKFRKKNHNQRFMLKGVVAVVSHLWPMGLNVLGYQSPPTATLPSCLWFSPYDFLPRCKFSTSTRQPMVTFYLLTFSRFPRWTISQNTNDGFHKNRTHDFPTRCTWLPTRLQKSYI